MAIYRLMARVVPRGPHEHVVTVSAIPADLGSAEVRQDTLPTVAVAGARRDFLVMSHATEVRARGHQGSQLVE